MSEAEPDPDVVTVMNRETHEGYCIMRVHPE